MDRRSWLWRMKSSERSPGETESSGGSISSHSERFSDDQGFLEFRFLITFTTEGVNSDLKMYVVDSKGGAIAWMLHAILFLGTWPAILTLLQRRGRLPQHTYLDYTITNLLAAVIIAFTFGEFGYTNDDKPNFLI